MTFSLWRLLLCVLMGYLIGCISPSYLIGRKKGYDVRTSGSCNAGASNTVIMAGKAAGIFVALFDILKATAACKLGAALLPELEYAWQIAGVSCVAGHMFPVFLGFRGGKGFACLGGVVLAHSAKVFLLMLALAVLYRLSVELYRHLDRLHVGYLACVLWLNDRQLGRRCDPCDPVCADLHKAHGELPPHQPRRGAEAELPVEKGHRA